MRLIDADLTLTQAWQNFHKQEEEHERLYEDYDILRDRHFEQCGFECCQQTIVNAPTVEAISKADYENRLKADMVAMLTDIQLEIEEIEVAKENAEIRAGECCMKGACIDLIQQKIDALGEVVEE